MLLLWQSGVACICPALQIAVVPGSKLACLPSCPQNFTHSTYLIWCSTSWEEVPIVIAVQRHVENIGVIVEGLLSPIPMVYILRDQENWLREDQASSIPLTIQLSPVP